MAERPKRPTRQDVAKLANTSTAVVSYVLNNGPRPVAAQTRRRVIAAISQLDYHPDSVAQGLARGRSAALGLVVPDLTNPFFAALAHALEDVVFASGRSLFIGNSAENSVRETELIESFVQQRVAALFCVGTTDDTNIDMVVRQQIPVVVLDRINAGNGVSSVTIDNVSAARTATEHLMTLGHRDIAMIAGPEGVSVARDRTDGFLEATAGLGKSPLVIHAPFTRQGGLDAGRSLLTGVRCPTAIFASNEQQAVGLLRAAAENDICSPEDLAITTVDGTSDSEFTIPQLTTVVQPLQEIASLALKLVENGDEPQHVSCSFDFIIRDSCGAGTFSNQKKGQSP